MKKYCFLLLITVISSCQKSIIWDESKSVQPFTMQKIPYYSYGDSIRFGSNIQPRRKKTDSSDHYLLGDSFYVSITEDSCIVDSVNLYIANMGGFTQDCKLLIDNIIVDTISQPVVLSQWGELMFYFKPNIGLRRGWHYMKLVGHSYAPDSTNCYYEIWDYKYLYDRHGYVSSIISGFVAHVSDGSVIPFYGLPIQKMRWFKTKH